MQFTNRYFFHFVLILFFFQFLNTNIYGSEQMINKEEKVIFLHHSTGHNIWKGGTSKISYKLFKKGAFTKWLDKYNQENKTQISVKEQAFPKSKPYGWRNYPYDYYNIWVKHGGDKPYKEEPTLEMLAKNYGTVVFKHCYPVSNIDKDSGKPDINSPTRTLENYKLQYNALKQKMREFPDTKFVLWTGAIHVKKAISEDQAQRMKEFADWVRNEWDEKGDNIFLWDFYRLETEGGLYLKEEYAASSGDSHPNKKFSKKVAPYFGQRLTNIIAGKGDETSLTGEN